jgi:hypothetical protein
MSVDFGALTQAVVAGLPDVRSCLVVSRDGLALGASPAAEEGRTLEVWTRIAMLGDVERGFVTVRDEVWVFCRRGAYGAIATASSTARPGLILDHLEQVVLMAEEARVRKESFRQVTDREVATADPSRSLRTPLHRDRGASLAPESVFSLQTQQLATPPVSQQVLGGQSVDRPARESEQASEEPAREEQARGSADSADSVPPASAEAEVDQPASANEGDSGQAGDDQTRRGGSGKETAVDRVELSREFAAILAEHEEDE